MTVEDEDAWATLWGAVSPEPLPKVDFKASQVIAVFLGFRPTAGYLVQIVGTSTSATSFIVQYREIKPAAGRAPRPDATTPYAIKVIAKTSLPVRFEKLP